MYQVNSIFYTDQLGRPLMAGTAIEDSTSIVRHQGLIAYDELGQQVVLENSFRFGGAVLIQPVMFNGGKQVKIVRVPRNLYESQAIIQRAWNDVVKQVKWTPFYNCQDFISNAHTGKVGSKTRDGIVLGGLAAAALLAIVG
ncbi:MAG: hypothetical protein ACLQMO_14630 [Acidobacteriaceae bacterium]|jgi:hypothetical protein